MIENSSKYEHEYENNFCYLIIILNDSRALFEGKKFDSFFTNVTNFVKLPRRPGAQRGFCVGGGVGRWQFG